MVSEGWQGPFVLDSVSAASVLICRCQTLQLRKRWHKNKTSVDRVSARISGSVGSIVSDPWFSHAQEQSKALYVRTGSSMSWSLQLPASPLRNKQLYRETAAAQLQLPQEAALPTHTLRHLPHPRLQLACVMDVCFPVQGPIAPFPVLATAWVGRGLRLWAQIPPSTTPQPLGFGFLPLQQLLL